MKPYLLCPTCGSDDIKKNGTTRRGKQNYRCRDCGRQFVENPQWKPIDPDRSALIDRLLLEKIPLAGIARVMQVSEDWLQRYVNDCYEQIPQQTSVASKPKGSHPVQMDELWSFVDNKGNKQWVWLALDVATREIIGCFIGDRSKDSAQGLWESLPGVYRQCAVIYTDDWEAYKSVLPSKRHRVVGKETGLTSYIERFNNTAQTTSIPISQEDLIILKEHRESQSCDLEFYSSLQRTASSCRMKGLSFPYFSPAFTKVDYRPFNFPVDFSMARGMPCNRTGLPVALE